ncbi:hypothetical protein [Acinetobacter sp.]|nr:hypothetical protein [Acinetobacter sp.]
MKWHANARVQNSAEKEQISFGGGEHIDLNTTKNINANIKLTQL